jgi:type IV pilus assembly protein PilA
VLANARLLATAADQYFIDHNVTNCTFSDLVGTDKYVKVIHKVMDETYPPSYAKAGVITITGVAGARTITYAP